MVCSISNHLATTGCQNASTAYEIDLPVDRIPNAACEIHGGSQMFAGRLPDFGQNAASLPGKLFRSFRKFFGGK